MRLAAHLARLVVETVRFGVATRRPTLVVVVVVGLLLVALAFVTQVAAPLAVYPFA